MAWPRGPAPLFLPTLGDSVPKWVERCAVNGFFVMALVFLSIAAGQDSQCRGSDFLCIVEQTTKSSLERVSQPVGS